MSIDEPIPPQAPPGVEPVPEPSAPDPEPLAPNPSEPEPFIDTGGTVPGQEDPGGAGGAKVL
jgi:hypothetical protein